MPMKVGEVRNRVEHLRVRCAQVIVPDSFLTSSAMFSSLSKTSSLASSVWCDSSDREKHLVSPSCAPTRKCRTKWQLLESKNIKSDSNMFSAHCLRRQRFHCQRLSPKFVTTATFRPHMDTDSIDRWHRIGETIPLPVFMSV